MKEEGDLRKAGTLLEDEFVQPVHRGRRHLRVGARHVPIQRAEFVPLQIPARLYSEAQSSTQSSVKELSPDG